MVVDAECTLTGGFGAFVQVILAALVVIVLVCEWLFERFCSSTPRTFEKFWFDSFKICTGAFISHCINLLVALYLNSLGKADACALYALAYYYECSGVTFVSLLQYGLVKYAQTKNTLWWQYLSTPGKYPPTKTVDYNAEEKNFPISKNTACGVASTLATICALLVGVLVGVIMKRATLGIGAGVAIWLFVFTSLAAPTSSRVQVLAWALIKAFEKLLWSLFVMIQASSLESWSEDMSLQDKHTEAIVYLALMLIVLNIFIFLMFSRISRLKIPCLNLKQSGPTDPFNTKEAVNVGLVSTFLANSILYVAACVVIRTFAAMGILFLTMLVLPLSVAGLTVTIFTWAIPRNYPAFVDLEEKERTYEELHTDNEISRNI